MSFFDKFFNYKSFNNKTENELKGIGDPLSFKSSNLSISKEQIRFLLFRECDRRGRKLLFDSNAVEKTPLPIKGIINCSKFQQQGGKKNSSFIETTPTHGYKYKKLSSDVACLGEMIFGSVAMTYKGENSCKIHKIPLPKQLMFTTIIHAPIRCHTGATNECSLENFMSSISESRNQKETSSDSKLYKTIASGIHKCSSTYPCLQNSPAADKLMQYCDDNADVAKQSASPADSRLKCYESKFSSSQEPYEMNKCPMVKEKKLSGERIDLERDFLFLNLSQKNSGCDKNSSSNLDSTSSFVSSESENVSSVSGSLSSLRRRWVQSCSTSLDITAYENTNSAPCKKRAKLGMALVLDISDSKDDDMENFLFNHTILIDSMMSKLQSSVELAYIKTQNFVDLIYTAFLDTQQSIHEFITGGKYAVPLWIALTGDPNDSEEVEKCGIPVKESSNKAGSKFAKACSKQDTSNRAKLKFLNDFHDVLVKFDTKDTNFFISTLLTAVLTHHLSWVTGIAETDLPNRHEKMQSVIKNYNPIWAQLNDLYGLLGSPLKCARTIVKGGENKKGHITAILQVLTYFIRCFNVIENVYDVDIQSVIGGIENSVEVKNFNSGLDSVLQNNSTTAITQNPKEVPINSERSCDQVNGFIKEINLRTLNKAAVSGSGGSLKRNKACLSQLSTLESSNSDIRKIRPDIKEMVRGENVQVEGDLNDNPFPVNQSENTIDVARGENGIPNETVKMVNGGYASPDEGYETIEAAKTDELDGYPKKIQMERQMSSPGKPGGNEIVFVLGENEKLINLNKRVVLTRSDTIELENEDFKDANFECERETGKNCDDRTLVKECEKEEKNCWRTECCSCCCCGSGSGPKKICCSQPEVKTPSVPMMFLEINLPSTAKPCRRKHLEVCPVFGGVNQKYNSEQIIQGVIDGESHWEQMLHKDLFLCAYNSMVEKDVSEALCIVGDVDSWEVFVRSSNTSSLDRNKHSGVLVGMSQLVADMLESFLHIYKINLPPNFCLLHIEKKLREIYLKSKTVAELLNSTDLCTIEYLTSRLDIGINDIPLLLSVATTHSPQISERYGLSFT